MSLQYIIDGNNIIHHPNFSQQKVNKAKDLRLALLDLILKKRLTGSPNNSIIIVFDGYPNPDNPVCDRLNIKAVFSRQETADARIRKILERSKDNRNTVVVSDDNQIRCFSRLLGARIFSVEEFILPRNKKKADTDRQDIKPELTFTQAECINRELRKIWLKD